MYETKLESTYQKSYYGKAHVINNDDGTVSLRSYETIVCKYNPGTGEFTRLWGGYSRTTKNHVNDFRRLFNLPALNKKEWEALPCENMERYRVRFSNGFVVWLAEMVFDSYESAEEFGEKLCESRGWRMGYAVEEC